jgi:2-succinyl-5-enolpyruvyl-6-hydroxy-3-cyclohexene-1-carboxylate synthase
LNWTVVNELQTNAYINGSIAYFDRMIANHPFLSLDVLITIGDQMISKLAREFFRSQKKLIHFDVAPYARKWDNLALKNSSIRSSEIDFLGRMIALEISSNKGFQEECSALEAREKRNYDDFMQDIQWKEFSLVEYIIQGFTNPTSVFWGNSSLIRYAHWAAKNPHIHNLVNRGISGIDGVLSTAIGYQIINQSEEFYCVLGDISMLYESNALQSIHLVDNIKLIVFNNFGGKIFQNIHLLEDAKTVITEHDYHFFHLAKMYDIEYYVCDNLFEFQKTFLEFQALRNTRAILELVLPEDSNSQWNIHLKHKAL